MIDKIESKNEFFKEDPSVFFNMEKEFDLFSLKNHDKFPIWDIVRADIWNFIMYGSEISAKQVSTNKLKRVSSFLNSTLKMFRFFWVKKPIFFFGCSRFVDSSGVFYDPYLEMIKDCITPSYHFYETILEKPKYKVKNLKDISTYIVKILKPFLAGKADFKIGEGEYNKISHALYQTYGDQFLDKQYFDSLYFNFKIRFHFYKFLLKLGKVKLVFLHQNGFQKGLIAASKCLNIPVMEFQHADVIEFNVVWHYGYNDFKKDSIIFPDVFLTYSDFWSANNNIPAKCYEIGTVQHSVNSANLAKSNIITVISTKEHEVFLNDLTIELAKANPALQFWYKLHPAQFSSANEYKQVFDQYKNISIVPVGLTIKDILEKSDDYVVVYSSVIFELLQSGKRVFIYKRSNYWCFRNFFHLPKVYTFDDIKEFKDLHNIKNITIENNNGGFVFYKNFNSQNFKKAVGEIGMKSLLR